MMSSKWQNRMPVQNFGNRCLKNRLQLNHRADGTNTKGNNVMASRIKEAAYRPQTREGKAGGGPLDHKPALRTQIHGAVHPLGGPYYLGTSTGQGCKGTGLLAT